MGGRGRGRGRGWNREGQGGAESDRAQGHASPRGRGGPPAQNLAQRRLEQMQMQQMQQMQQLSLNSTSRRPEEGGSPGPSRQVEGERAGPSRSVEGVQAGPSRSVEGGRGGPSRRLDEDGARSDGSVGPVGRGAMRGRRVIEYQFLRTKPDTITTKQGNAGNPSPLTANYFKLTSITDWTLHQYRVDIAPEEDRTFERKKLLKVHQTKIGGYIFDGTVLYSSSRLTTSPGQSITWTSESDAGTKYTITVRHVNEVKYGDYSYQQVFNILMRNCIRALGLQLVGRDYYDPDPSVKIQIREFGLELWPGYKTSIRQHEAGILMCAEITHKIMRTDTVLDHLAQCLREAGPHHYRDKFSKEIIGCIVLTKYNNKTYQITDVDYDKNPASSFTYQNADITFAQYMQTKYQIQIRDMRQPLLVSKAKAREIRAGRDEIIDLIPEVCYATGLSDNMRGKWQLMAAVSRHTRIQPAERVNRLLAFNRRLQTNPQVMTEFGRFNMSLDNQLVRVPGRQLGVEKIYLGRDSSERDIVKEPTLPSIDWTNSVKSNPLIVPKHLTDWFVLVSPRDKQNAGRFLEMLERAGRGMGITVQPPQIANLPKDGLHEYIDALTQILNHHQPKMVMVIVPNNNGARYAAIKKKCCVDRPVPSQVLLGKNLNDPKRSMSVATKVMIQMNCKLGGAPWSVNIPPKGIMVVGFDVCHDSQNKASSYGAMVASLDDACTRYFSAVTAHTSGEELSNNLALNIIKAVRKFREINNKLPAKIFIYRDGVGEGQIQYVYDTELQTTLDKLAQAYGEQPVSMAFIIVTKRINTRLFKENQNPPPGTIADDVITDPEKYDFFLVSQSVRDGTVTPTSYNVIHDTSGLKPNHLQWLTYKLCHLYYNWSGTVRVPAPCQYAHKLAFLVGNSLHREPHLQLEDLLYFL
ncbi:piwi-like protein Siwi [Thrips palmi]|uniref:Piwi-like protein Siwi n=1 Tax=Thrips palmi TaxID=161013 RepID=A0A6P9AAN8_THRPL|nr:piwi-like protein Siwi [Thrips palmi]XP_034253132.1 piwi-like protein Siwi [Thrips palmi]